MSLDWNIGKIKNWQELRVWGENDAMGSFVPYKDQKQAHTEKTSWKMDVCTETLVFSMMSIQMGEITEKNWQDVYTRMSFLEKVGGAQRQRFLKEEDEWEPIYYTPEDIKRRIGLATNVGTRAASAFYKNVYENHRRDCQAEIRRLEQKQKAGNGETVPA